MNSPLNAKSEKILLAVMQHPTLAEAAKSAGVSVASLYRAMAEEDFKAAYADARKDAVTQAIGSLQQAAGKATETLLCVMQSEESPASAKISAARSVLEYAFKGAELLDLEERLTALETMQAAQEGVKA